MIGERRAGGETENDASDEAALRGGGEGDETPNLLYRPSILGTAGVAGDSAAKGEKRNESGWNVLEDARGTSFFVCESFFFNCELDADAFMSS